MKQFATPRGFDAETAADFMMNQTSRRIGTALALETETMRVWHLRLAPGERLGFHRHDRPYFWSVVTDGRARSRYDDGRVAERTYAAGDTNYFPDLTPETAFVHDIENTGESELVFVTVEFETEEHGAAGSDRRIERPTPAPFVSP
jgi:beta-alanine degradation protein BauB